jgi:PAS domain S-box-containing protein
MLAVVTPEGILRRINPAFGKVLGYEQAEIINQQFIGFVHPDDVKRTEAVYQGILLGRPIDDFENRYRRKDGTYRYFSWRATVDPVTGDVYAVARDITDHRATETQLRHAQKMEAVGQLAGGVAHDFNNLMQAVLANVEFGLSPEATRAEMNEHLNEIASAGHRAAELTKQLLVFSRSQRLDRVSIDLNSLLGGLMKLLSRLLPENIVIQLKAGKNLPMVSADQTQLEQVVTHLCVNARDSMESGGTLTLETSDVLISESDCEVYPWTKAGYFVCLSVSDTGTGMSPEVRERVFEPFFTTKADRSGTGLGLSTLYGIVEQHGGMVHVYSEPGLGTSFKVYLPADELSADKLPLASAPGREHSPAPRGTETILVVEDEESVRRPVLQILKRAGYRTFSASNGREGIERLQEHLADIHLVILDVVMPEMGGPEAWEQMVVLRPDLVSIFMSGYADARYRKQLPPDFDVLDKPFPARTLLERVRMRLDGDRG